MGMPKIEFRLQMFRGDWDQVWSQLRMLWLMEALCRVNQTHLRQMNEFKTRGLTEKPYPPIYRAGLHYETEKGTEIWPDIPSLMAGAMGEGIYPGPWGDCEDFACARVAEYRELPYHYKRPRRWSGDSPAESGSGEVEVADPRFPPPGTDDKWSGWSKIAGGIAAKPFAKWRRGPEGNYHYHALCLTGDGRLEDPSLVLGMGRESEFAADEMAEKMKNGAPVIIQYAQKPDVMVVDPEKPSGYAGGKAGEMDKEVAAMAIPDDAESGAYKSNEIPLGIGEFDVDAAIGWDRNERRFSPKSDSQELRRLLGYVNHD